MNKHIAELLEESTSDILGCVQVNQLQFAELIVRRCADIIYAHAESLEKYKFTDKANTAKSCGGMVLEHFGLKENHDTSNRHS